MKNWETMADWGFILLMIGGVMLMSYLLDKCSIM